MCYCRAWTLPSFLSRKPVLESNQKLSTKFHLLTYVQIIVNIKGESFRVWLAGSRKSCSYSLTHQGEHSRSILGSGLRSQVEWLNSVEFPLEILLWEKQRTWMMLFLLQPQLWFNSMLRNSSHHSFGNEWHLDETKAEVCRKKRNLVAKSLRAIFALSCLSSTQVKLVTSSSLHCTHNKSIVSLGSPG